MTAPASTLSRVAAHTRNLTKVYDQGNAKVVALDHVDVDFARGRFTAVMGPSGSGKSTLMHCVAGLDKPTSGDVFVGDTAISTLRDSKLTAMRRDRIGFVFQAFNLVPTLTARENIELPLSIAGRKPDREWFDQVISTVGLGDRLMHKPSQLSGGQQQRVACARALVSRPDIIFADEPTGNLDSRSSAEVLGFLARSVTEMGQTIVMVTHDPTAAARADRVLFLADGRIVGDLADPTRDSVLEHMALLGTDDDLADSPTTRLPAVRLGGDAAPAPASGRPAVYVRPAQDVEGAATSPHATTAKIPAVTRPAAPKDTSAAHPAPRSAQPGTVQQNRATTPGRTASPRQKPASQQRAASAPAAKPSPTARPPQNPGPAVHTAPRTVPTPAGSAAGHASSAAKGPGAAPAGGTTGPASPRPPAVHRPDPGQRPAAVRRTPQPARPVPPAPQQAAPWRTGGQQGVPQQSNPQLLPPVQRPPRPITPATIRPAAAAPSVHPAPPTSRPAAPGVARPSSPASSTKVSSPAPSVQPIVPAPITGQRTRITFSNPHPAQPPVTPAPQPAGQPKPPAPAAPAPTSAPAPAPAPTAVPAPSGHEPVTTPAQQRRAAALARSLVDQPVTPAATVRTAEDRASSSPRTATRRAQDMNALDVDVLNAPAPGGIPASPRSPVPAPDPGTEQAYDSPAPAQPARSMPDDRPAPYRPTRRA